MNKVSKVLAFSLAALMSLSTLAACSSAPAAPASSAAASSEAASAEVSSQAASAEGAKEIYYLNFKPEIASVYDEIAKDYEAETGVKLNVVTAASGTYEQTLTSEIAKDEAPTIFQINGPVGYQNWKDYCLDLKDTELYKHLTDKSLAVTSGDGVYGIPYAIEGYGIIYNNAIMSKYFALPNKKAKVSSAAEINNFATLKEVVEDMTANAKALGIKGVFASTSLTTGEDWRWQTHLANIPFFYEFKENTAFPSTVLAGLDAKEIAFKYSDNYKNIFDLYTNNSCTKKGLLGSKSVDDSMAEFALGNVAMVQNGNWAWGQISKVDGNTVKEADVKFMPIYTGVSGEEKQGLCVGTENFFAINSKVSADKQKASIDFINWLFTSDKGKSYVSTKLGFIAPFDTFTDAEKPSDPLAKEVLAWSSKKDINNVAWTFAAFPSQKFKDDFGAALLEYVQGGKTWDDVKKVVIDGWKTERAAAAK
ncbi:ABC transporter substrate-binding protein [Acetanaerobacterium elongatum]|uniref:Carbohydrate ABC transporter substrate-binding protein, CUT1 family n=1 Tax=Acetanaerobacterium elongatum TaxID=258515 RepID=A0A1G9W5X6_9FIRM|nr:ABC transporter substrate-binding protein [Acetanaerobacterium elongatum]SDM79944.1 carbohydrate ABC transporter substrate-binding protein, CUT1 family [Acetanaerobacterium elongatum]